MGITSAAICMKPLLDQSLPQLQNCLFLPSSLSEMEELYSLTNSCNIIEMLILYMSQHSNNKPSGQPISRQPTNAYGLR